MSIFQFFKPKNKSANVAKERLQLVLAHNGDGSTPAYLPLLKEDIIVVVTKHLGLDPLDVEKMINVEFENHDDKTALLELNIELPESLNVDKPNN
ncbi:cell division topological specificity factor MinE [Photobacterium leiognathi]|uniref:cell division topological specificity factor MinE n=1 Tax=Photobacterium leiognathi TaxID=553611 RepID=UPI001EDDB452|nr:cell division topological specificity factor MinE [Photobacterium leiognathi]MCG3883707.1 cell division topological specificity factor MinE [Photobacterium leiognathi]